MGAKNIKTLFQIYTITGVFPFDQKFNISKISLLVLLFFQLVSIFFIAVIINSKDDLIKDHLYDFLHIIIRIATLTSFGFSEIFCSISMFFVSGEANKIVKKINGYLFMNNLHNETLLLNLPNIKLILLITLYFASMSYFSILVPLDSRYQAAKFFYYYVELFRIVLFKSFVTSFLYYLNLNISMNTKKMAEIKKLNLSSNVDLRCRCLCELIATIKSMLSSIFGLQLISVMIMVFLSVMSELYKYGTAIKAIIIRDYPTISWRHNIYYYVASTSWSFICVFLFWDIVSSAGAAYKLVSLI